MTIQNIVILLCAALTLSLLINFTVLALHFKRKSGTRTEKNPERQTGTEASGGTSAIPEELLPVILTAAASAVLGKGKKNNFRVISFRRADQEKKKGLYEYD